MLPALLAGIEYGSHMCAFYECEDDLIDLVLPFFAGGASRGEACVWVAPGSMHTPEAALRLRAVLAEGGVELYAVRDQFFEQSRFAPERAVGFWNEKLEQALQARRPGLRASGDVSWPRAHDWNAYLVYEHNLTKMIADKKIALLCTISLSVSKAGDIFEAACTHHLAIGKRKGEWEAINGWRISAPPRTLQQKRTDALDAAGRVASLSRRERQVLDGLAEGRLNKEIAAGLGISVRTVEEHRARLLDRLEVRTTAEAVRLATLASLIAQP
ncbi:MAG: MEDS domain-containing protein [Roseiarcus sp.]